jgi:hypothetical protein
MSPRLAAAIAIVTLISSLCGLATAQAPSAADKAVAETLFQEGRKLLTRGELDEACAKFAESNRLAPRLGTLLNLATCHEKQGKTASAWAEFTEAAAIAKQDKRKDREKFARDHAASLEKKLSRLVLEVSAPVDGTVVELDSEAIGRAVWGTPIPVDPGSHQLEVSAPGHERWSKSLTIKPGPTTISVSIPKLEPEPSEPDAKRETPEPSAKTPDRAPEADQDGQSDGSAQRTIGWLAIGAGVVGIGIGSYFGLQTFSKQNESEDHCNGTSCDQTGIDLRSEAKTTGTISTIGFAAGAVGLGAGLVLLLTADGGESKSTRRIWIAPGLASVTVGGEL